VSTAAVLAGSSEHADLNSTLLHERLATFGIGTAEGAALRALSRFVDTGALGHAVLAALEDVDPYPSPAADEPARWRFCRAMGRLAHWDLEPGLINEILHLWLDCCADGADAGYAFRAAKILLDCCSDELIADEHAPSRPELEILAALHRVALCVASLLVDARSACVVTAQRETPLDDAPDSPNAQRFISLLDERLAGAPDANVGVIVVQIDHDNAAMPMSAHDRRLSTELAERMRTELRSNDTLCALGKFEWGIILPDLRTPGQIALASNRLVQACLTPIRMGERRHLVIAHAGGAVSPDDATESIELLRAARLALESAARHGTPYELYQAETGVSAQLEYELEEELLGALTHNRLQLDLQPQVDAATGRCVAAEALLRWQRRSGEWVPPPLVIATVERLGGLRTLSRWLINHSARAAAELHRRGVDVRLSINLTAADLRDFELPDLLQQSLSTWGAPPGALGVELTESAVIADEARTYDVLSRLRELGCSVSIDDFGTGYSSMIYLRRLPLHEIKLDRIFVRNIVGSPEDRAIVAALVQLAHSLGLQAVAEGVEDEATLAILREIGCERAQGYLFGKPMPFAEFVTWWQARHGIAHAESRES